MANRLEYAMDSIRSVVEQFGPNGDPVLKWIGFAVVFLFVIVLGVAISATVTAIANLFAQFHDLIDWVTALLWGR